MSDEEHEDPPIFAAVSSSARQLYHLLRCIGFAEKANVQISEEGIRFSVEETSVMEGLAFLDKSLFTTYTFDAPASNRQHTPNSDSEDENDEDDTSHPTFTISLPSLLETLQIFGLTEPTTNTWSSNQHGSTASSAFAPSKFGVHNLCRLYYPSIGSPLTIILTESTIRTTCDLTTYEPSYGMGEDIPFARDRVVMKVIMRAQWLWDAINELGNTGAERVVFVAGERGGKKTFKIVARGSLGSIGVEFGENEDAASNANPSGTLGGGPTSRTATPAPQQQQQDSASTQLLETFLLSDPSTMIRSSYKFSYLQKAARAMAVATKVSVRMDDQGVLSLQFMIEVESGKVSFVEFHFVPLVEEEDEEEEDDGDEDGDGGEEEEDEDVDVDEDGGVF